MKPEKFKHCNVTFAENQPEYISLPALKIESKEGHVITCWKLSFKERLKILFIGKMWLKLLTFNKPLTPSLLSVHREDMYSHPDFEITRWQKVKNFFKGFKIFSKNVQQI